MTLETLLEKLGREGGCLVASADCDQIEIAAANARGDMYVDANGFGFIRRCPEWLQRHSRFARNAAPDCCEGPLGAAASLARTTVLERAMPAAPPIPDCIIEPGLGRFATSSEALAALLADDDAAAELAALPPEWCSACLDGNHSMHNQEYRCGCPEHPSDAEVIEGSSKSPATRALSGHEDTGHGAPTDASASLAPSTRSAPVALFKHSPDAPHVKGCPCPACAGTP